MGCYITIYKLQLLNYLDPGVFNALNVGVSYQLTIDQIKRERLIYFGQCTESVEAIEVARLNDNVAL